MDWHFEICNYSGRTSQTLHHPLQSAIIIQPHQNKIALLDYFLDISLDNGSRAHTVNSIFHDAMWSFLPQKSHSSDPVLVKTIHWVKFCMFKKKSDFFLHGSEFYSLGLPKMNWLYTISSAGHPETNTLIRRFFSYWYKDSENDSTYLSM